MNIVFNRKFILILLILFIASLMIAEEINTKKYMLRSALIPGWGELTAGNKTGLVFLASEVLLLSSRFYFLEEADLKDKASFNYAVKYAHINPNIDITDEYYYHMSRYMSSGFDIGGYNAYIVEIAKIRFPDDPQAQTQYIEENSYSDDNYWGWDDEDRKKDYSILRKRITQYGDYAKAITGAVIANHIISALNAFRVSSRLKNLNAQIQLDSNMNPIFTLQYNF
ncbi:MAG: hypothetical protein PF570_08135 [Candidatus Cloacimonetes bacterium]|jgi:hypothetical protein|nr:hypothetical protein [Candidatus Cloacimonadota bacterium]